MQAKLTLSIDPSVVVRAKHFAKKNGISLSQLVEIYLDTATKSAAKPKPSFAESFRGILRKGDRDDYRAHLVKKYL